MKNTAGDKSLGTESKYYDTVKVAGDLFLEHGYAGVSVNSVVERVGGSNRDLYAQFGDKEGLFRKVISGICYEVLEPLQGLPQDGSSTEKALLTFGRLFLKVLLSPRVVALQRLVMSEAKRYPEFIVTFTEQGPFSAYRIAGELLKERAARGEIVIGNSRVMGALFCDMLIADLQFRLISGIAVTPEQIEERVQLGVSTFLNGVKSSI